MRGASPTRKPEQPTYSSYPQYAPNYLDSDYSKDGSYDSYSSHDDDKQSKKKRSKKRGRWEKERERDRDDKRKKNRKRDSSGDSDEV